MTNRVRVSLVFPRELWEEVKRAIPVGQRSKVIAEAMQRELRRQRRLQSVEQLRGLQQEFHRRYGQMSSCAEDIRDMREKRVTTLERRVSDWMLCRRTEATRVCHNRAALPLPPIPVEPILR